MGLRMETLHSPTVLVTRDNITTSMSEANKLLSGLMVDKDHMESELKALSGVLDSVSLLIIVFCVLDATMELADDHSMVLTWKQVSRLLMAIHEMTWTLPRVRSLPKISALHRPIFRYSPSDKSSNNPSS